MQRSPGSGRRLAGWSRAGGAGVEPERPGVAMAGRGRRPPSGTGGALPVDRARQPGRGATSAQSVPGVPGRPASLPCPQTPAPVLPGSPCHAPSTAYNNAPWPGPGQNLCAQPPAGHRGLKSQEINPLSVSFPSPISFREVNSSLLTKSLSLRQPGSRLVHARYVPEKETNRGSQHYQ